MAIIEINEDNFESEVLNSKVPVLADFNADWCGPCRMLKPTIDKLSEERKNYKFVSINVDDNENLAHQYGIFSIPCIIIFDDGKEIKRNVGLLPKEELEKMLGDK